ncbi:HAMP domain-containing protein [Bacillus sp. FJAT-26390]|nr:HAMP domain-containing protein [Bacillus sp. FJAT-26390]
MQFSKPIVALTRQVGKIAEGDLSSEGEPFIRSRDEIGDL